MPTNYFEKLMLNKTIAFHKTLSLGPVQRGNLELDVVRNLISKEIISLDQILALPKALSDLEQTNLGSEAIQKLILSKDLYLNKALSLNVKQRFNLEAKVARLKSFINHKIINIDKVINFTPDQIINFIKVKNLFSLMKETSISIDRVLNLTDQERFNLNCKKVRKFLREKKLSLDDALQLTENQRKNLRSRNVDKLIENDIITLEALLKISDDKTTHLSSNRLYDLISEGLITTEQAFKLPTEKISDLTSVTRVWRRRMAPPPHDRGAQDPFDRLYNIINTDLITTKQFFQLNFKQMTKLLHWNVGVTRVLTAMGKLTFDENGYVLAWPNLSLDQEKNLICMAISELILDGTITYEAALELTNNHRRALKEPDIKERLRNGELTLADLDEYAESVEESDAESVEESDAESDENYPRIFINNAQSTHATSVHQSVSESAIRLYDRYENQMNLSLEKIISEINKKLKNLTGNDKKEVAIRCFARLIDPKSSFIDPNSKISTKQLMALFDLALFDETNSLFTNEASKEEGCNSALKIWVDTLNEIQRGYNQNEFGNDKFICASGTFNKFIEKLCGIHTDCQIVFLTPQTASLKFLGLMKEEAIKRYLELGYDPEKLTDEFDWQEKIFSLISDLVKEKLFIEFRPLFSTEKNPEGNPQHPKLLEIIKQTEYISIKKFDMENYIKNNKGIKLSSNTLNNASFFSIESNNEVSCPNTSKVCLLK